jgi:hypothetical protein
MGSVKDKFIESSTIDTWERLQNDLIKCCKLVSTFGHEKENIDDDSMIF